jgi:hypothetical protein
MEGFELLKSSSKFLTWGEIKEILDNATPEQLKSKALIWNINNEAAEIQGGTIDSFYQASEDHINPSGDGVEPISFYTSNDEDVSDEPIVIKKGDFLAIF